MGSFDTNIIIVLVCVLTVAILICLCFLYKKRSYCFRACRNSYVGPCGKTPESVPGKTLGSTQNLASWDYIRLRNIREHLPNFDKRRRPLSRSISLPQLSKSTLPENRTDKGSWFYKLVINCDGKMVDVDSGNCKSICSNTVKNLQNITSKEQNEISEYLRSLICQKEKEFEILLIFSTLLRVKRVRPEDWIRRVVLNRQAMACYMLLAYYTGSETNKENIIIPALRTAIAKGDKNIANIIHWFIIREYFRSCSFEIDYLLDIWPAVVCKRSNCYYPAFCSKDLVIMVQTTQSMENMPVKFWNIEIQYMRQAYEIDIEEKEKKLGYTNNDLSPSIENSFPEKVELDGVLASDLFKKHSKLTLICKSVYKLKDGVKIERPCIQLFCRGKGYIPVKENHFPKHIKNVETDILEGGPVFARRVRVGDKINSRHHIGTLGGFVQILGDITLLTCAHVVLPEDNLNGINLTIPSNKAIYIDCEQTSASNNIPTSPTIHTKFRCGKLRYIEFRTDRPEETSIDAALINLQDDVKMDENDYIANRIDNKHHFRFLGMRSPYLNENSLDHKKLFDQRPIRQFQNVTVGATSGISVNMQSTIEMTEDNKEGIHIDRETITETYRKIRQSEYQAPAHSSTVSVLTNDIHLQETRLWKVDKTRTLNRISRCMYNQISATNIPFKPGDSGTCIYVCDNSLEKYGCIGMAIANNPGLNDGVILTPMKDILKTFKVG